MAVSFFPLRTSLWSLFCQPGDNFFLVVFFFFLSGLTQTQDIHYSETRGSRERNREEQQKGWGDGS